MRDVEDTALAFDRACRAANVRYAFMGGIAIAVWGQPRATADVDALADLNGVDVERFASSLRNEGLDVEGRDLGDAASDGGHVTVFDKASLFHVDVKPARHESERAELARAVELDFRGQRVRVVGAEESVAFKLSFGSPQDLQDARSILVRQQGRLDLARLRDFARRLGVETQLDAMLDELA